ncbi:hypothetical protein [Algoriphagus sp.]|uniref:hypothetical protein n=1 Tax=Algoriphagus sp. TaxID=1872435 RepID=UPI00257E9E93|nr:hypothetical protein [Algoriphagus sp.]
MQITKEILESLVKEELEYSLEEKRKRSRKRTKKRKKSKAKKQKSSGTKDACYYKVKSRYSVWPSAYASGALVRCRKVGAKNWGNKSKKNENLQEELVSRDIQALHSKMKDRYEVLKAKKEKSREEERNELRMKKALDDPGLKQALADDRKRQSLLDLFNFNLEGIISEVIDEVLAEKKSLKNGQALKDQNEQKAAQTQKVSQ